jgi:hypothetical protein
MGDDSARVGDRSPLFRLSELISSLQIRFLPTKEKSKKRNEAAILAVRVQTDEWR